MYDLVINRRISTEYQLNRKSTDQWLRPQTFVEQSVFVSKSQTLPIFKW